jgi:hypothetical protein
MPPGRWFIIGTILVMALAILDILNTTHRFMQDYSTAIQIGITFLFLAIAYEFFEARAASRVEYRRTHGYRMIIPRMMRELETAANSTDIHICTYLGKKYGGNFSRLDKSSETYDEEIWDRLSETLGIADGDSHEHLSEWLMNDAIDMKRKLEKWRDVIFLLGYTEFYNLYDDAQDSAYRLGFWMKMIEGSSGFSGEINLGPIWHEWIGYSVRRHYIMKKINQAVGECMGVSSIHDSSSF